jgi:transposase
MGWLEEHEDITMPELAGKLETQCGIVVHPASLSRFLIKQESIPLNHRHYTVLSAPPQNIPQISLLKTSFRQISPTQIPLCQ